MLREALAVFVRRPWRYLVLAALLLVPLRAFDEVLTGPWYEVVHFVGLFLLTVPEGAIAYAVLNESTLGGLGLSAYVRIASRFARLVLASLVWGLLVVIGFVLLIIPGCLLIACWSVYVPAIVVEPDSGLGLGRSRDLTVGHRWVGFWLIVIPIVPATALWISQLVTDNEGHGWRLGVAAVALVATAYGAVALAVFYRRLVEHV